MRCLHKITCLYICDAKVKIVLMLLNLIAIYYMESNRQFVGGISTQKLK